MAFPWAAAATIGSTLLGGFLQKEGREDQNAAAYQIAQEQMAFQERMANTSWQRGVKDMRKAGINPMLAFSQGGASSPAGASAPVVSEYGDLNPAANAASALAARRQETELDNIEADTRVKNHETWLRRALTRVADADARLKAIDAKQREYEYEYFTPTREQVLMNEWRISEHNENSAESKAKQDAAMARLLEADVISKEQLGELWQKYPKLRPFLTILNEIR